MEQYQFYEEIGCGGFSNVYKGRLRRSVEFVAIRRIEKGHSAKISAEVQVMHAFDHANVLKFQAWFATTNHLWVISEYCAGGDLRRLLLQDGSLPEETVLSFGLDVLAALHYVHSHGVLVIDLRPTSMLINEYGVLKLADFGHARCMESPLSADNEATIQRLALLHEMSPSYIAPELLARTGGYSAASDFWALGSLLVEMSTGLPPYANCRRAEDMVQAAMFAPLPPLPESSELLNDLLQRLHAKRAADRPVWAQLGSHPFWRVSVAPGQLPAPVAPVAPSAPSAPSAQVVPKASPGVNAARGDGAAAAAEPTGPEASVEDEVADEVPLATASEDLVPDAASGVACGPASKGARGAGDCDLYRSGAGDCDLYRSASTVGTPSEGGALDGEWLGSSLESHDDAEALLEESLCRVPVASPATEPPAAAPPGALEGAARTVEEDPSLLAGSPLPSVRLSTVDATVSAATSLRSSFAAAAPALASALGGRTAKGGSKGGGSRPTEQGPRRRQEVQRPPLAHTPTPNGIPAPSQSQEQKRKVQPPPKQPASQQSPAVQQPPLPRQQTTPLPVQRLDNLLAAVASPPPLGKCLGVDEHPEARLVGAQAAAATAAADAAAAADRSLAEMAATATAAARERLMELGATTQPAAKAALQPLSRLLFSPAEMAIRPVMLNAAIEKLEPTGQYEARSLKFRAHSLEELLTMDIPTLEAFLATLWRSVGGPNPVAEKENTLLYFEALATNGRLATVLINSGLTGLFSTMLRTCAHSSLKLRLATLLALLLRHTTYVQAKLARTELLTTLAGATRDRDAKVRRRATAALGELIFYIAVQQQQQQQQRSPRQTCHSSGSATGLAGGGTPDEAEWAQPWTPPPPVPQALLSALLPTEEPTTSHYAAKALENVFAASVAAPEGSIAEVLGTAATLTSLVRLATSTAAPEPVRITAAAAAAQLVRLQPSLGPVLLSDAKAGALLASVRDGGTRLAQPMLTAVAAALLSPATRQQLSGGHGRDASTADSTRSQTPSGCEVPPSWAPSAALQRGVCRAAISAMGRPQAALALKGGITLAAALSLGPSWLHHASEVQMLAAVEKAVAGVNHSAYGGDGVAGATWAAMAEQLPVPSPSEHPHSALVASALAAALTASGVALAIELLERVRSPPPPSSAAGGARPGTSCATATPPASTAAIAPAQWPEVTHLKLLHALVTSPLFEVPRSLLHDTFAVFAAGAEGALAPWPQSAPLRSPALLSAATAYVHAARARAVRDEPRAQHGALAAVELALAMLPPAVPSARAGGGTTGRRSYRRLDMASLEGESPNGALDESFEGHGSSLAASSASCSLSSGSMALSAWPVATPRLPAGEAALLLRTALPALASLATTSDANLAERALVAACGVARAARIARGGERSSKRDGRMDPTDGDNVDGDHGKGIASDAVTPEALLELLLSIVISDVLPRCVSLLGSSTQLAATAVPLLSLLGTVASAVPAQTRSKLGASLEELRLPPLLLRALCMQAAHRPNRQLPGPSVALVRCLAERPAMLLDAGLLPLLQRQLTAAAVATPAGNTGPGGPCAVGRLMLLFESLYLTLFFVRELLQSASVGTAASASESAEGLGMQEAHSLHAHLLPLLESLPLLYRLLVDDAVAIAEQAAHCVCLLAQTIGAARPQSSCRALLVADGAAGALLRLFDRCEERPHVVQTTLKALAWLRAADADEFDAAIALCPELEASCARLASPKSI